MGKHKKLALGQKRGRYTQFPTTDFAPNYPYLKDTPIPGTPTTTTWYNPGLPGLNYRRDVVTGGFKDLIARGIIVNNPLFEEEVYYAGTLGLQHGDCYLSSGGSVLTSTYDLVDYRSDYSIIWGLASTEDKVPEQKQGAIDRRRQATIDAAFADANSGYAQLLVELAELGKTLQMFGSPLSALEPLMRKNIKVGNNTRKIQQLTKKHNGKIFQQERLKPKDATDAASNVWLQWRYGVGPLMHTIKDLMDAYEKNLTKPVRYTGRAKDSYLYNDSFTRTYSNTSVGYGINRPYRYDYSYQRSGSIKAGVIVQGHITPAQALGLSIDNLPSAAYELVHLSFVLDWVFDVGNWLRARTPAPNIAIKASWCTVTDYRTEDYSLTYVNGTYSGTNARKIIVSGQPSLMHRHMRRKTRTPGVQPGLLPTFVGDTITDNLNHLIDAVALAYQSFSRKHRSKSRR